jgi:hypothetical protein
MQVKYSGPDTAYQPVLLQGFSEMSKWAINRRRTPASSNWRTAAVPVAVQPPAPAPAFVPHYVSPPVAAAPAYKPVYAPAAVPHVPDLEPHTQAPYKIVPMAENESADPFGFRRKEREMQEQREKQMQNFESFIAESKRASPTGFIDAAANAQAISHAVR